ncbi:cell envelope integrity protein TolA [Chromobacterium alticapitis]|uniref:Cell envelope biogenesis protein TolA n=1 Tax=Chromobacterium alticapitis TaxID=2073169 RepID=A0A2S5DJB9_9NEIS|nr:cell envelope integrity protein TolA [Chromobacterium alticapitis]POZ63111.1 cell envelope biogenesis protein TolA [Chromobacterium alticapitis]
MNAKPSSSLRPWSVIASALFHAAVIGLLLWGGLQTTPPPTPAPLALELWTTAPPPPATAPVPVAPAPAPKPVPAPQAVVAAPPAEVNLGKKEAPKPKREEKPKPAEAPKPEPKKHEPKPEPKKPEPKPKPAEQAKPKPEPKPKPVEEKKTAKTAPPPAAKPGHRVAKAYNNEADDLLSSLDSTRTSGKPNARSDQAGSKNGIAGGAVNGSGVSAGWIDKVKAKVTPLVQIPPGISGNPAAQLRVTLLPTLEVKSVQLVKSSGVPAYDDAVQRAVWEAKTFPKLPDGASFNDGYRTFTLTFRPH